MAKPIVVAAALAGALAALAPNAALARDTDMGRMADELSNPRNQRAVAGMMEAMTEMLMSMKVAPLARAMDGMGDHTMRNLPRNATLADVAGPEARRMPREVSKKVPQMMGAMASMTGAMEAMLPQLQAMAEKMKDTMGDALPDHGPDHGAPPAPGEATQD